MRACLAVFSIFALFRCGGDNDTITNGLEKVLNATELDGKFVILTYHSCMSCVEAMENYMRASLKAEKKDITFILTGYATEKEMKIRFREFLSRKNLIFDNENNFYQARNDLHYPLYLEFENGIKTKSIFLDLDTKPSAVLPKINN